MPPLVGALIAIVFWGISFVATKAALREVSPVTLVTTRFALGVLLLFVILLARRQRVVPPRDAMPRLVLMGFIGVFVHQLLQSYALTLTSATQAGWLIGLTPVWSAILAAIILKEAMGAQKVGGLVVAFAGAMLVLSKGEFSMRLFALPATRGDLLIFVSTLNWAIYTVVGHPTIRRLGPSLATFAAMLPGWLMLLPFFLVRRGWVELQTVSAAGWGAILFLGIGCSGLGYLFWYGALERVEASRVAALLYLEPLVTLIAAIVLLGERVRPMTIAGGVLVLAGVLLVQRAPSRTAAVVEELPLD